jgi:GT2 family glycosyltransferase
LEISVVIVNYKVPAYLHVALDSLQRSAAYFSEAYRQKTGMVPMGQSTDGHPAPGLVEVFVVDNHSEDNSHELIAPRFPWIHWIGSTRNLGFAKANNWALKQSSGRYAVLQNPDTVLSEDTLWLCWEAMENDPRIGGLGVKMLDGRGLFLKESKRGFPDPASALYKLTGLSSLFPRHPRFSAYHLGHLDPQVNHQVSVLAGAYMWVRASVAAQIGWLDERYFMYGEDIDWSYRIVQAGYTNLYLAQTRIVHFKGESTQKQSMRYVRLFYGAMITFAERYYDRTRFFWLHLLLRLGIAGRAGLALLRRWSDWFFHPMLDLVGFAWIMLGLTTFWEQSIKTGQGVVYPDEFRYRVLPVYVLLWVLSSVVNGAYEKPYRPHRLVRGILLGSLLIGFVYAFLPMEWRFSRGIILAGAALCLLFSLALKGLIRTLLWGGQPSETDAGERRVVGYGSESTLNVARSLLQGIRGMRWLGVVSPDQEQAEALASRQQWHALVQGLRPQEVVLDARSLSYQELISTMEGLSGQVSTFKFLPKGMDVLVGAGEFLWAQDDRINQEAMPWPAPSFRRGMRAINLITGCALLVLQVLARPWVRKELRSWALPWLLIASRRSWISYRDGKKSDAVGVFDLGAIPRQKGLLNESAVRSWVRLQYTAAPSWAVWTHALSRLGPGKDSVWRS